ncbi:PTS transporter subunit IIC [Vagococcus humatus]|uniref:Phosphotransferase system EIIC domain-containing protein n=1 Tax=Vagococcus humatus TaxID=1889241 RepID=A0A3S0AD21_9ENTE|nr:PTS sugar transporter subunit IIC [Vagococcus humatus]RST89969.1 hypothetical protein C7P63_02505 [Vagococcus humatus]
MTQAETAKMSGKDFLFKVLNGTAIGIIVGLIPNAVLGEIFKALNGPIWDTLYQVVFSLQFATPAIIGVLVGLQFGFNAMQATTIGTATFVASGAVKLTMATVNGIEKPTWVGGGIGDLINVMITAAIASYVVLKIKDHLGSLNAILLPILGGALPAAIGVFLLPYVSKITALIGSMINGFTTLQPVVMSVLISITFSILIISPISTVAIGLAIGLEGISSGSAAIGVAACTAVLVVASMKVNESGTTLAILLGAMKMMMPNMVKKPVILVPIICTAAVSGVVSALLNIQGIPSSAGFGLVGLVGPIHAFQLLGGSTVGKLISVTIAFIVVPFVVGFLMNYLFGKVLKLYGEDAFKYNV